MLTRLQCTRLSSNHPLLKVFGLETSSSLHELPIRPKTSQLFPWFVLRIQNSKVHSNSCLKRSRVSAPDRCSQNDAQLQQNYYVA